MKFLTFTTYEGENISIKADSIIAIVDVDDTDYISSHSELILMGYQLPIKVRESRMYIIEKLIKANM